METSQSQPNKTGMLFMVATPIGNLEDMTYRAVRVLREVDRIVCEDTRVTAKLLARYEIQKPLMSWHHHSQERSLEAVLENLETGEHIAYVTDAGTPGISDPGNLLVERAVSQGIHVEPIPGVSALSALASIAGIDMQQFVFLGFPPHKKGRKTFFERVASADIPVVYYESPHRVMKNLELLQDMGFSKKVVIGRELTKMFETVYRGSVESVLVELIAHPEQIKGEFSVIVAPAHKSSVI